MLIMILMLALLLISFIISAIYSGNAAARTGGKNVDQANKNAHSNYVNATIVGWVSVGVLVLTICLVIYFGAEALAAAKSLLNESTPPVTDQTKAITTAQVVKELAREIFDTPEATALNERIEKEAKSRGFFERLSEKQTKAAKAFRGFLYFMLFVFIALAITAGIYAAIGSAQQQKSESKKGLKPGTIAAIINLFVAGMFIVFFTVMYFRDRSIHEKLSNDLLQHDKLAKEYSSTIRKEVTQAKALIASKFIEQSFQQSLSTPSSSPVSV